MSKDIHDEFMPETAQEKVIAWDAIAGLPANASMNTAREMASNAIKLRRLNKPISDWR